MYNTVLYDASTGEIRGATLSGAAGGVTLLDSPLVALQLAEPVAEPRDFYVSDGTIRSRPMLPEFPVAQELSLSDLPPGSTVTVTNEAGDSIVITSFREPLRLVDPGRYTIAVDAPFPYLPFSQELEIPDA